MVNTTVDGDILIRRSLCFVPDEAKGAVEGTRFVSTSFEAPGTLGHTLTSRSSSPGTDEIGDGKNSDIVRDAGLGYLSSDEDLIMAVEEYEQHQRREKRSQEDPLGIMYEIERDVREQWEERRHRQRRSVHHRSWWIHRNQRTNGQKGLPYQKTFELKDWATADLETENFYRYSKAGRVVTVRNSADVVCKGDGRVFVYDTEENCWIFAVEQIRKCRSV